MPNAKDQIDRDQAEKIFITGQLGGGKTTQVLTLPRPTFCYLFDPGAYNAIKGHDVEFEEYLAHKMNITVEPIPKGGGTPSNILKPEDRMKAQAFAKWENHFMESLDNGFFDKFNTICLDSITTLYDIILNDLEDKKDRIRSRRVRDSLFMVGVQNDSITAEEISDMRDQLKIQNLSNELILKELKEIKENQSQ